MDKENSYLVSWGTGLFESHWTQPGPKAFLYKISLFWDLSGSRPLWMKWT